MRVAVITEQCLGRVPGGTGRYTRELAAALGAASAPGDVVVGWVARHSPGHQRLAAITGVAGPRTLALPPRALALLWARGVGPGPRGADVVHAPTLLVPPSRPGVPLVVTIHDAVPWTHPETMTAHGARWHRRMAARAARDASAIVVPTTAVANEIGKYLDVASGRLAVVGEGVSTAVLDVPSDADARATRLGLPPAYLLVVATFEPRKGLDTALDALALAGPGRVALPLLVVGQAGWGGVSLAAAAAERDLGPDRVRALGRLTDADLAVVYSRATALLAPSRSEGFGLPVLEAMAHGLPVIVSATPALVEVVGEAGVVVPVGDAAALAAAVSSLVADPAERTARGQAGRRRSASYSWGRAAETLWELYRSIG